MTPGDGSTIAGFADPFSVNIGQTVNFMIQSPASSYTIDIYRIGYYGGDGARLITSLTPNISVSQNQPSCNSDPETGLVDCGNWGVSASWTVPSTAVSGVYTAHLVRTDGVTDDNEILFVVTNNASTSDVVYMTSDETWQAYNNWGGYSLYTGAATNTANSAEFAGRAEEVSYNRPLSTSQADIDGITIPASDDFYQWDYPMIRFMEENGYDVSYVSQADVSAPGGAAMLEQHKVFMTTGHSEYWDPGARDNVTAARDAGVNLAFFAGNLMWWKTAWAASSITGENYRTLITYKESLDSTATEPGEEAGGPWTGAWRDPRFSPPEDGGQPENALTGQLWMVDCCSVADQVPYAFSKLAIWANTAVANLQSGGTYTMPDETLGPEWDSDIDNGFRPAGEIDMSQTCVKDVPDLLLTPTQQFGPGNACNSLTLYRASSGALVFDAGTMQWSWGLDADHDGDSNYPADPVMQQATVNLFAMMGVQPATLMSGLVAGTDPDDTSPPTSTITSPSAGATFGNGSTVTITGTATDSGGGVVAGVEVSTDGGSTWHPVTAMSPANTTVTWSYTWSAAGDGSVTILSRATDDDGNTETPGPGVSVTVNCPCGLFGADYVPAVTSSGDTTSYELGMKFQSTVNGWVAGVRFYKGPGNDGTHTGSLWTSSGTLLATGTFTNETATGWQSMLFANPVQITANTTYVVSYYDPDGDYSADEDLFDWPLNTAPLTALKSNYGNDEGGDNGLYNLGGPGFPTTSHNGTSYAVDVIFDTTEPPGAPPSVSSAAPYPGSSSNPVSADPSVTFSKAVVPSTVSFAVTDQNGNPVAGTTSLDSTDTVATFTPTAPLASGTTYTVTVSGAQDDFGQTMTSPYTYTFTTSEAYSCPCSVWPDVAPSGATDAPDSNSLTLGLAFSPSSNGTITGVRFYKEADNTGTHTGSLWSSNGTLLATGTFSNESTEGWQQLNFSTPVAVTAGQTYVASYFTTAGHYAVTVGGLASAVTNGPLTAEVDGGVYAYGSTSAFPTSTYEASNYWVDVVYSPAAGTGNPPSVSSAAPYPGSSSNPVSTDPSVTFSEAVVPSSVSFAVTDQNGNAVAGTTSLDGTDTIATFTPTSPLAASTTYNVTVSGAQDSSGQAMTSPYTYSFTTSAASTGSCPCSVWPDVAPSGATDAPDSNSLTLGLAFSPSSNGTITGVRFYKEADNTGTHTGSLWSSNGTLLATGTFSNESTEGWQQLNFSTPVAVTAGQTYVASYFTTAGHYAVTVGGLASAVTNGPLTAEVDGGVYAYGSTSAFPTSTYEASNYWVDVVYSPAAGTGNPPSVSSAAPYPGSSSNPVSTDPSVTFSEAVVPSSVSFAVTDQNGNAVAGTTSLDGTDTIATFTPTSPLAASTTYNVTVSGAQDSSGQAMTSPYTYSFTTSAASTGSCPCSIWSDAAPPGAIDSPDTGSVELGVTFQPASNGTITGVRFYKEADNTGTHTGSLWSSNGTLLATGTFSNESTEGWQQLNFSTPVAVTAGQTYVASYHTTAGHYAVTLNGLTSAVTNGPLTAEAVGGVYAYGSTSAFPTNTYDASNYWVDVVFAPGGPTVTATNPLNGQTSVPTDAGMSATFNEAVQSSTIQFTLTGPGGTSVPGTVSYDSSTDTATFVPSGGIVGGSGPLSNDTTYTATLSGAEDDTGAAMSNAYSWSFTTAQATPPSGQCPCSIWPDSAQPSIPSANDTSSVNLGVEFTAAENGWITGIRFYKGAGNAGTHVGSLWDASGDLLGQVTFTGESTAGWQQANFSSPIAVTAGTTYVASYLAPNGGYAVDVGGLASAVTNAPLTALANGGVYTYASSSAFPTSTYNSSNYWVDVVFTTTAP